MLTSQYHGVTWLEKKPFTQSECNAIYLCRLAVQSWSGIQIGNSVLQNEQWMQATVSLALGRHVG